MKQTFCAGRKKKIEFEYVGLEGAGTIDEVNEDEMEDELDFSMM